MTEQSQLERCVNVTVGRSRMSKYWPYDRVATPISNVIYTFTDTTAVGCISGRSESTWNTCWVVLQRSLTQCQQDQGINRQLEKWGFHQCVGGWWRALNPWALHLRDLLCAQHTDANIKEVIQHLCSLGILKRFSMFPNTQTNLHRCIRT